MEVKVKTEKTYWVGMTETQARNLVAVGSRADELENDLTLDEITTLSDLRLVLLNTGLSKDPD